MLRKLRKLLIITAQTIAVTAYASLFVAFWAAEALELSSTEGLCVIFSIIGVMFLFWAASSSLKWKDGMFVPIVCSLYKFFCEVFYDLFYELFWRYFACPIYELFCELFCRALGDRRYQ